MSSDDPGNVAPLDQWVSRSRQGRPVGRCRCGGRMFVPRVPRHAGDDDPEKWAFQPFTIVDGWELFEASCDGCGYDVAQWVRPSERAV